MPPKTTENLMLQAMPAPAFYAAIEGPAAFLHAPTTVPYYVRENCLAIKGQAETRMFVVSQLNRPGEPLDDVAGLAELDTNPDDSSELWLFYVSVAPAHLRKGHGRALLNEVAQLAQRTGQRLSVSYASKMSLETGFQALLKQTFDDAGIPWTQGKS